MIKQKQYLLYLLLFSSAAVASDMAITQDSINITQILLACFTTTGGAFVWALLKIGHGVETKLEGITHEMKEFRVDMKQMSDTMIEIKDDLRADLAKHDTRITVLEMEVANAVERRQRQ